MVKGSKDDIPGNPIGQNEVRNIEGTNIKYVKREKVKISPKSKLNRSKKSGIFTKKKSKIELGGTSPKSEDAESDENLGSTVDKRLGEFRRQNKNKVKNIIAYVHLDEAFRRVNTQT